MGFLKEKNQKTINSVVTSWLAEYYIYVLVILAIVLPLFLHQGYVFFVDFHFGPHVPVDFFSSGFLMGAVVNIFSLFYFYSFGEKLFIAAVLFLVLLGGKKIAESLSDNKWIIFITSLFFLFNPFVYGRMMYGQIGVLAAFGLLCLALGYGLSYVKDRKNIDLYRWGIFTGLSLQFSSHFIFFSFILYGVLFSILLWRKIDKKQFLKVISVILLCIIILNTNWILGYIKKPSQLDFNQNFNIKDLVAFQTSGKTGSESLGNVLMMSGFWGKERGIYADLTGVGQPWGISFLLLSPIIFFGLFIGFKKKEFRPMTLGLISIFIIAVVLAIGIRLPISREITYWLFNHVPFYKGLRESAKWVSLIVIIYGIWLTFGLNSLLKYRIVKENRALSVILVSLLIVMQAPFLLFGFKNQVHPVNYPQDWQQIDEYIISHQDANSSSDCKDLILFLPWHLYMSFSWIGSLVVNPANSFFSCPVIQGTNMEWAGIYDNSGDKNGMIIKEWLEKKNEPDSLINQGLNIKYIILAKEVDWQEYQWLDKIDELKLVKETDTLKLYELDKNE